MYQVVKRKKQKKMKKIAFSQKRCTNFNADFCTKCQKTQKTISKTIQKSVLNFVQKHNKK